MLWSPIYTSLLAEGVTIIMTMTMTIGGIACKYIRMFVCTYVFRILGYEIVQSSVQSQNLAVC